MLTYLRPSQLAGAFYVEGAHIMRYKSNNYAANRLR